MTKPRRTKRLSDEKFKQLFKEAIAEWAEEKYAEVGRWTVGGVLATIVLAAGYFFMYLNGWSKLPS